MRVQITFWVSVFFLSSFIWINTQSGTGRSWSNSIFNFGRKFHTALWWPYVCLIWKNVCLGLLPVLFMVSFAVQKLVSLTSSHFLIFVFFLCPWETDLRIVTAVTMSIVTIDINCYNLCQRVFYLFFFLEIYGFILYLNLNDFDLIFVYGLKSVFCLHWFSWGSPAFPAPFVKRDCLFHIVYSCYIGQR